MGERREPSEDELLALRAQAKVELRKRLRAIRQAVPADARKTRSARACERLVARPEWASAEVVAGYVAMRAEADPQAALTQAVESGKTVVLPRMDFEREEIDLVVWKPGDALAESGMGFLQPPPGGHQVAADTVDLIIVPALAVDARGYRIGWGKGHYDRLLVRLERACAIAFVFHFQLMAEVPEMPHDIPVHVVVSDKTDYEANECSGVS